ncbi:MAG: M1 family metallopeptidase [Gemmatimonadaceae bacterium]|nr:M1 family metallopeptidase [Chitinophagaceae bacterium]
MKKWILWLSMTASACQEKPTQTNDTATAKIAIENSDPHTYARPHLAIVKHLDLALKVDFATQKLQGKAVWTIENVSKGNEIIFDVNGISIEKITTGEEETPAKFTTDSANEFMGAPLKISILPETKRISIYYSTSPDATAVQWLTPKQTAGKKHPFLFTQSQSILARTWVPCQDGPGIRFTYNARIQVPKELLALMSAENPQQKNDSGIYHFKQTHPIPSYLLALSVGDLAFKSIDSRTGVYAEPSIVAKAAWEFADMGRMADAAEKIYIPYRWGRYDVLVLPPSFPFGGMENPNLTFATPTLIAGDRSLVSVIAHELAHSWTGNLVTNATWNDMWLNEGFTTYFERRIVEAVYGEKEMQMQEVLGRETLNGQIKEFGATSRDTKLKGDYAGRNPDDAISEIPYEKGYSFLRTIEAATGRENFDAFMKKYLSENAFQSKTSEEFLEALTSDLLKNDSELVKKIEIKSWVYEPGLPTNAPPVAAPAFKTIDSLIGIWSDGGSITGMAKRISSANERLYFLGHLPATTTAEKMTAIDNEFNFTSSNNAELQCDWYTLSVRHQYKPAYPGIEAFLKSVGRRKFLMPIYKEMKKTPDGLQWAKKIFAEAKEGYHPLAVQSVGALLAE